MSKILNDHNGGVSQAVFMTHFHELQRLEKAKKEVEDKIKAQKKRAKEDGIVLKDFETIRKELKITEEERIARHNRLISYRRFLSIPSANQMQYVEETQLRMEDMTEEERRAHWRNEGLQAGLGGKNRDECPHNLETEAAGLWMEGYDEGQAKNAPKKKTADKDNVTEFPGARKTGNAAQDALNAGAVKRSGRGRPKKVRPEPEQAPEPEEEAEEQAAPVAEEPPAPDESDSPVEEAAPNPGDDDDDWEKAAPPSNTVN